MHPTVLAATFPRQKVSTRALLAIAAIALGVWQLLERRYEPAPILLEAAERMTQATAVIRRVKLERGLMQPAEVDRNQTGLIGPEWSEITTTLGNLEAKRTVTNPDLAALIARLIRAEHLGPGERVAVVLSGSFVGGNVAVLSALEALGIVPIVVSSLGASMYGAADPSLTWLDMEAIVRDAGLWRVRSDRAVLGGDAGQARDLAVPARDLLRAAAERHHVPLIEEDHFDRTVEALAAALRLGAPAAERPRMLINVGGAQIAIGSCEQAERIPPGVVRHRIACTNGTPALVQRSLDQGIPVLNVFKIKEFARHYGLAFDPAPLPAAGTNRAIYGR